MLKLRYLCTGLREDKSGSWLKRNTIEAAAITMITAAVYRNILMREFN